MSTLAPKQNDTKISDVINIFVGNSSSRTKVNPTDDIWCTLNNSFVNTANNKFFNSANNVDCSRKNTDRVISNTENTSEEVLSESSLENVIPEFKRFSANVKDSESKTEEFRYK